MNRPMTVRIGILLLSLALILRTALLLVTLRLSPPEHRMGVAGEAARLLIFGGMVYALARGNNWARIVLAFVYVTGAVLTAFFAFGNRRLGDFANPIGEVTASGALLLLLMGAGVMCLFLPSASAWYHASRRSSLTSA